MRASADPEEKEPSQRRPGSSAAVDEVRPAQKDLTPCDIPRGYSNIWGIIGLLS